MSIPKSPALLAVNAVDEEAKKAIAEIGGRVELASTRKTLSSDGSSVLSVILVWLPAEKAEISATHHGSYDITLTISEQVEVYLELDQAANVEDVELRFLDRVEEQGGDTLE